MNFCCTKLHLFLQIIIKGKDVCLFYAQIFFLKGHILMYKKKNAVLKTDAWK